ncbi:MAG: hypothetical protein KGL39_10445 [Patescibacteria group bacterium]|nr:hypothetical protein [Patescibacteria group bacterium]
MAHSEIASAAIAGGHISVLGWVLSQGPDLPALCDIAASYGRLEIIKWLKRRGYPVTPKTLSWAIRRNQPHIVEYLLTICPPGESVTAAAAETGDLKLLQHLIELNYPVSTNAAINAAGYGRLDVLRWLVENKYPLDRYVCYFGCNSPGTLEYLKTIQCPCGGELH